ncbi:site-2 protease family protein [Halorientalis brevis]|uniref:Zinc metalloprotease n=1 Tax=Halorientalis brevis TaxID=1126241 RepID=A0ABD6C8B6_9EURY|nr:site-2 protease family protein [Halorientalis brevis]
MASVRIGSVFGIPIKLGTSFLLVVPLIAYLIGTQIGMTAALLGELLGGEIDAAALTDGVLPWVLGLAAALGLFLGVFLHELGHSLVARRYGVHIEAITLWFLGGLAQFEEFPDSWTQELKIAIAGPIVSVVIGALCYGGFAALPADLPAVRFVLGYLAVLNVVLAGFNLLPGFPMDGGRVLRALLSRNRSRLEATQIAAGVGKAFAVLLTFAGILLFNVFWIAIAFFIYLGATGETRQILLEDTFEGLTVGDIMTPAADLDTVTPTTPLSELLERMIQERHTGYPVLDGESRSDSERVSGEVNDPRVGDLRGLVTLEDVQSVDPDRRDTATVGDVMSTDLQTVSATTGAEDAVTIMQRQGIGRVLVTDERGDLEGLVSRTDLMTVFEIRKTGQSQQAVERIVAK